MWVGSSSLTSVRPNPKSYFRRTALASSEVGVIFSSAIDGENTRLSRKTVFTSSYRVTIQYPSAALKKTGSSRRDHSSDAAGSRWYGSSNGSKAVAPDTGQPVAAPAAVRAAWSTGHLARA